MFTKLIDKFTNLMFKLANGPKIVGVPAMSVLLIICALGYVSRFVLLFLAAFIEVMFVAGCVIGNRFIVASTIISTACFAFGMSELAWTVLTTLLFTAITDKIAAKLDGTAWATAGLPFKQHLKGRANLIASAIAFAMSVALTWLAESSATMLQIVLGGVAFVAFSYVLGPPLHAFYLNRFHIYAYRGPKGKAKDLAEGRV